MVPDRQKVRTDGRRQNYIPPTSSGDNKCKLGLYGPQCRKPVFLGMQTIKEQTSLHVCAVWSAPLLFAYCNVSYLNLLQAKFQFSVAEKTGLSLTVGNPANRFCHDKAHLYIFTKTFLMLFIAIAS